MITKHRLGQTLGFAPENEKIPGAKLDIAIGAIRFCGQKKETALHVLVAQLVEGIPKAQVDFLPVIEAGAFQFPIVDGKTERLDQMQGGACCETEPANVAGVGRNLRFYEDDVETSGRMEC